MDCHCALLRSYHNFWSGGFLDSRKQDNNQRNRPTERSLTLANHLIRMLGRGRSVTACTFVQFK